MNRTVYGGYIHIDLHDAYIKKVTDILVDNGIPKNVIVPDMHVTMMYDLTNPTKDVYIDDPYILLGWIRGVIMLGDRKQWICLSIEGESIYSLRKQLEYNGYVSTYPNFEPHLSLVKDPTQEMIDIINSDKVMSKLRDLMLVFKNVKFDECKP